VTPYYDDGTCVIYHGDAMEVLPTLDPVSLVVTDPPYFQPATHYVPARGTADHQDHTRRRPLTGSARAVNRLVLTLKRWWNSEPDDWWDAPIVPAADVIENRRWLEEAS
jgi:hypothetical protein